ncbi:acyl-CoA thioesterase [Adhaeribacter radiodurans]|uniref:Acyl-CoA thioesterase n=1 Tax=Adhaeribacter radiodurans TaxID=2745197 RepID=A0A7L7L2I5_9BACT|nr:acyl-CoA thioesterase [Adhaeribacter radiodurans]QMU26973.1 acyl-CoA thioesterase [Adhaeribacter radiodurans]
MKIDAENIVKSPETKLFVRFQDCDALGHLNNVRYFDYFLNTREEHTRYYYALNLLELSKKYQANWVVTHHQTAYLRPADLGENIIIQTQLVHFDENSIVIEGTMFNEARTHLKSLLWTTMRYVSMATGRSTEHPAELLEMINAIQVKEVEHRPEGFQKRLSEITQGIKNAVPTK